MQSTARSSRASPLRRAANLIRTHHAVPLIAALLLGPASYLGGAPAFSIPLWTAVAFFAVAITGENWATLRRDRFVQAGVLAVSLAVFQLLPWPPVLLQRIDAESAWVSAGAISAFGRSRSVAWRALHMDPGTGWSVLEYLVGVVAAYVASRRIAERNSGTLLISLAATATLWISGVALAHKAWGLERVWGLYLPQGAANEPILSPIMNANHLAAFSGAGMILWLASAIGANQPAARLAAGTAAVLCGATTVLTLSRGGIIAAFGGVFLTFVLSRRASSRAGRRFGSRQFQTALVILGVVVLSFYTGWEAVQAEYATPDLRKLEVFVAAARIAAGHPLLGVGPGGLYAAIGLHGAIPGAFSMEMAESLPLDLAIAFGIPAALALLLLGARWLFHIRPKLADSETRLVGAYAAVVSLVVHDLGDFALWMSPAGMLLACLGGVLAGEVHLRNARTMVARRPDRSVQLLAVAGAALAIVSARTVVRMPDYVARDTMQTVASGGHLPDSAIRSILVQHPGDPYLPLAAATMYLRGHDRRALRLLARAMALSPRWGEPHRVLADALVTVRARSQAMVEVRLALQAGTDASRLVNLLVALAPDRYELDRLTPQSQAGRMLLDQYALAAHDDQRIEAVDEAILQRFPFDPRATLRQAARASAAQDSLRAFSLLDTLARRRTDCADCWVALADWYANESRLEEAVAIITARRPGGAAGRPFLERLGEYRTRLGDTDRMREAMRTLMELAGSDVDQRIRADGLLGGFEERLRHDAAALSAFERADALALPDHPYLERVIGIAQRAGDVPRVRAACRTMIDEGHPSQGTRTLCAGVERGDDHAI